MLQIPLTIETPRLILRAPDLDDAPQMYEAIRDSMDSLRPWLTWAQTLPDVQTLCRQAVKVRALMERCEFCAWRMFLRENDVLVGEIHLHHWDWTIPKCELGYWGRTGYVGRGLVTEAAKAVLSMASASLGVRRVEALCEVRNEASQRLARRVGFVQAAILPDHDLDVDGKPCDEVLFVWLAPEH